MKGVMWFVCGVTITMIIVMVIGMGEIEKECNDAGGVLTGTTCINPSAVIEVD